MFKTKTMVALSVLLICYACNNSADKRLANEFVSDSIGANKIASSNGAIENNKDTERKFIRTAELKFKVNNVVNATYNIEDITNRSGGFVTYTNLASNINNVVSTPISADSSVETAYYTVTNTITLRVPNNKLDTAIKEIAKNIDYLDYRIIKAEDVALQIIANNLTQKRVAKNEERLAYAIDAKAKKLEETRVAEDVLLTKQEQADNAAVANLSLKDQVNYSTINLSIYQREAIKREVVCNNKNISAYEPSFGNKMLEELKCGGNVLLNFILFLTKLWSLMLLIIVVFFIYKKYQHKIKK